MFSSRLPADLSPNPLSVLIEERRGAGADIIDLTESNPTRVGLEYPEQRILRALSQAEALVYDPHPRGMAKAREAVAAHFARQGHGTDSTRLHLTASSSESYAYLLKLLTDPGDEVLAPRPSYPLVEHLAGMEHVRAVPYTIPHDADGQPRLDLREIERACTPRSRAVIIINPNNPTGRYMRGREWEELVRFCTARSIAVISDEVFFDYPLSPGGARPDGTASALDATAGTLVFTLGGFSKMLGLPQLKLGWIASNGPDALLHEALEKLDLIADTYLSANTPVQHAAAELLACADDLQSRIRARCLRNLDALTQVCSKLSDIQVLTPEAGWNAVLRLADGTDEEELVLRLLRDHEVLVHPGYFFDFTEGSHLVLSLLPPCDRFEIGLRRIASPRRYC